MRPCFFHGLQDHLLLLQGLEAPLAHVGGLVAEGTVGGGREVPSAALPQAPLLDETRLHEAMQGGAGLGLGLLGEAGCTLGREAALVISRSGLPARSVTTLTHQGYQRLDGRDAHVRKPESSSGTRHSETMIRA